jgi:hypothetical protein
MGPSPTCYDQLPGTGYVANHPYNSLTSICSCRVTLLKSSWQTQIYRRIGSCAFSTALVLACRHVNVNSKQKYLQAKPEDTLDLSRLLNDDLAAKVRTNPHRLVSTIMFYSLSILEKYKWNISSFRNYLEKFRVSCVRPEV